MATQSFAPSTRYDPPNAVSWAALPVLTGICIGLWCIHCKYDGILPCTQPRSSIFELFDDLLLLTEGRAVYAGPAADAVEYFAKKDHPCPDRYNPAEFLADLISVDTSSPEAEQKTRYGQSGTALEPVQLAQGCPAAHQAPVAALIIHLVTSMCMLCCLHGLEHLPQCNSSTIS